MTFSVLVAVPAQRLLGAACASRSLAVGHSVPAVVPGLGAVVSQSWTNRSLRSLGLAALRRGTSPRAYVADLPGLDADHSWRQVGVLAADGAAAAYTGRDCAPWAGHREAHPPGATVLAVGNLIAGPDVLDAVVDALAQGAVRNGPASAIELAALMVDALVAGQERGGDVRGEQSASLVVGSGAVQPHTPPDLDVDLRVDDAARPLVELGRLLDVRTRSGGLPVTPRRA